MGRNSCAQLYFRILVKKTVGIISLGCPRNLVDSEAMLGKLVRAGFEISEGIDNAEIAIVQAEMVLSFVENELIYFEKLKEEDNDSE